MQQSESIIEVRIRNPKWNQKQLTRQEILEDTDFIGGCAAKKATKRKKKNQSCLCLKCTALSCWGRWWVMPLTEERVAVEAAAHGNAQRKQAVGPYGNSSVSQKTWRCRHLRTSPRRRSEQVEKTRCFFCDHWSNLFTSHLHTKEKSLSRIGRSAKQIEESLWPILALIPA